MKFRPKAPDMEVTAQRFFWMVLWRLAVAALIISGLVRFQLTNTMIFFVLAIPAIGVLAAGPIMIVIGTWFQWQRGQPYAKWQGNYYEFANTQIRVLEIPNDHPDETGQIIPSKLWFVDQDILKVLGRKPTLQLKAMYRTTDYRDFPDENVWAFSEVGAKKLLMVSTHPESKKMMLWIEREVIKVHRRRLEMTANRHYAGQ